MMVVERSICCYYTINIVMIRTSNWSRCGCHLHRWGIIATCFVVVLPTVETTHGRGR